MDRISGDVKAVEAWRRAVVEVFGPQEGPVSLVYHPDLDVAAFKARPDALPRQIEIRLDVYTFVKLANEVTSRFWAEREEQHYEVLERYLTEQLRWETL